MTILEHSRIFYFANGGSPEYYASSADWMPRNLERRVEILFPIEEEDLKEMLTYANAAASIITTRRGALRVMPTPAEIESIFTN